MKKLLSIFLLSVLLLPSVFAESVTTNDNIATLHQSWDLDLNGLNDCENEGNCDDSIDYTKAKVYPTSADFLKAEGGICQSATDGCNSVSIVNGKLNAMTEMYCEDTYGTNGQEKWSCNSYDQEKINYEKYIRNHISELSTVKPVLGGTWYVTQIDWISDEEIKVTYEDGHIQEMITLNKKDISIDDEPLFCTMQYAPVCAEVQVQCIRAPCPPIQQTFGNSCSAGKNKILYKGECDSYVNMNLYNKYLLTQDNVQEKIKILPDETLSKAIELVDILVPSTKLLKIFDYTIRQRITKYIFLKNVVLKELSERN